MQGYFVSTNPANAFFYVLTGLHVLHHAGRALVVWSATIEPCLGRVKRWRKTFGSSVELCAVYWHFVLLADSGFGLICVH